MARKISPQELLFCYHYIALQNPKEAAIAAGFPARNAANTAASLLMRPIIKQTINGYTEKQSLGIASCTVSAGLHRLAFGSVSDALKLLCCEDEDFSSLSPDTLDLFNIQEIKKMKGGGFEIKFYDRLKALEKLNELSAQSEEPQNGSFYAALERSAAALEHEFGVPDEQL